MAAGGWKDTIRNIAPAIGHALGAVGVPGANALAALSQALLGRPDATEAEVAARVANWTPADELALKAAEQKFVVDLLGLANRSDEVQASDRASARDMQKTQRSSTPTVLSYIAIALFASALGLSYFVTVPASNHDMVNALLEVLKVVIATVFGFWLGGSFGSDQKTAIMGRIAEGKR